MKAGRGTVPLFAVADQALSSATNFLPTVVAARLLSTRGFGAYSVAFLVYTLALTLGRSLSSDPLLYRCSSNDVARRAAGPPALGTAFIVGAALGLPALGLGALLGNVGLGVALGLSLPGLLVTETLRHLAFAELRPDRAARIDGSWLALTLAGVGVLVVLGGSGSPGVLFLAWSAPPSAIAVWEIIRRSSISLRGALPWIIENRPANFLYLAEYASGQAVSTFGTLIVSAVAGLAAAGSVRGAYTLLGPLIAVHIAVGDIYTPEAARLRQRDARAFAILAWRASAALAGVSLVGTALLLLLPQAVGERVLGDSWAGTRTVLLAIGITHACGGVVAIYGKSLRILQRPGDGLRIRLLTLPVVLGGIAISSMYGGAIGGVSAMAVMSLLLAVLYGVRMRHRLDLEGGGDRHSVQRKVMSDA